MKIYPENPLEFIIQTLVMYMTQIHNLKFEIKV